MTAVGEPPWLRESALIERRYSANGPASERTSVVGDAGAGREFLGIFIEPWQFRRAD
jgi:hypothetical protein